MIRVYDINGRTHYLALENIQRISEMGPNSAGIRAIVKLADGDLLEAFTEAEAINAQIEKELAARASKEG